MTGQFIGVAEAERMDRRNGSRSQNTKPSRFIVEAFDAIELGTEPEWRVRDIAPSHGLMLFIGEPGCGKSFLAADFGLHVAMGKPWAGKSVEAGTVVYITGEGASGFRKRLRAFRQHYRPAAGTPFYLIADSPDLGHRDGDAVALINRIRDQIEDRIDLVIFDTVACVMKGADENSAADMSVFVNNCGRIGSALGCLVAAVHHLGKDASKGARGSTALKAAADIEIMVEGTEGTRTATVTKSKDGEAGLVLAFGLDVIDIDAGEQHLISCIVSIAEPWKYATAGKARRAVTGHAKVALDALRQAIEEAGETMPTSAHRPNKRGCSEAIWRRYCEQVQITTTNTADAKRMAFKRSAEKLQSLELIGVWEGWVWTRD